MRQTPAQYRASLKNLKKAQRKRRHGGRKHYRTPAQRRALRKAQRARRHGGSQMSRIISQVMQAQRRLQGRGKHYRTPAQRRARRHGGAFNPAMLMQLHQTAQQVKPLTKLVEIGDALGISKPIGDFLEKSAPGRYLKKGFNFLRNTLGYGDIPGQLRFRRVRRVRRHRPRRIRVKPHVRQVGGTIQYVRGHIKRHPRAGRY